MNAADEKCDLCEKPAYLKYHYDGEACIPKRKSSYFGGLCPEHATPENEEALVERWKNRAS